MKTPQAAVYLGVREEQLRNWRKTGAGPKFTMLGTMFEYAESDLDAFKATMTLQAVDRTKGKPAPRVCVPVVREQDHHLFGKVWQKQLGLWWADEWEKCVATARQGTYDAHRGIITPADHQTHHWRLKREGGGFLDVTDGWMPGMPHWCFDLQSGDAPAWVRANVDAIVSLQKE